MALAQAPKWKEKLRSAVESELLRAQQDHLSFAEFGGWAIAAEYRHTKAALEILLGSFVWAELLGHCLCATTATFRNNSASILRRIGGRPFLWNNEELPGYFDPQYECEMELLRFDSREVPVRFAPLLREMRAKLMRGAVLSLHPAEQAGRLTSRLPTWKLAESARL